MLDIIILGGVPIRVAMVMAQGAGNDIDAGKPVDSPWEAGTASHDVSRDMRHALLRGGRLQSGDGELDMKEVVDGLPRIFPGICVTTEDWHVMIGHDDGEAP